MSDMPFWGGDEPAPDNNHDENRAEEDREDLGVDHEAGDHDEEGKAGQQRRGTNGGVSKAKLMKDATRSAQKALDLHAVDDTRRERVAAILGLEGPDVATLAVATVMARPSTLSRPVDDIEKIATEEPMAAVVGAIAQAENRERFTAAWTVAACYSDKLGKRPPAVVTKAAFEFAAAVTSFGDDVFADMRASLELIRG